MDKVIPILESQVVFLHRMRFSKFSSKWKHFWLVKLKTEVSSGKVSQFIFTKKKSFWKDLCTEKAEVKNYMNIKNEGCFKTKIKVALCSSTTLQHLQAYLFIIFVGKAFYCRFQFWLICWKKSQEDLAFFFFLIKFNKRWNKWTNEEGTYARVPCPGLWKPGPRTLPKLTVSLCSICHELKGYLKRREPDALQFSCLKTSIAVGFPLVAMEAGAAPHVGTGRTHGRAPPDPSVPGGRRQAVQARGDHPAHL